MLVSVQVRCDYTAGIAYNTSFLISYIHWVIILKKKGNNNRSKLIILSDSVAVLPSKAGGIVSGSSDNNGWEFNFGRAVSADTVSSSFPLLSCLLLLLLFRLVLVSMSCSSCWMPVKNNTQNNPHALLK